MLPSLKLGQKGILLMLLLLVIEGTFIGANFYLLHQAELQSKQEERTKEIIDRVGRLLTQVVEAGDKVGKYAIHKDDPEGEGYLRSYVAARDGVNDTMNWLRNAIRSQPQQVALFAKIDDNVKVGMEVLETMKKATDEESRIDAMRFGVKQRMKLQPRIEELVHDLMTFKEEERELEDKGPQLQQAKLQQTAMILVAGAVVNVLMVAIAFAFIRGITKRLEVVSDNSSRWKNGESLHAPMSGGDEITILDQSFHKMVSSLRGAESLLRSSENAVLSMVSQMPAGLLIIDGRGQIAFANPKFADALGYEQDDLSAVHLSKIFSSRSVVDTKLFDWLKEKSDGHVIELTANRRDAGTVPVEFSITDVSHDEHEMFLAMALDVSERHEMEKLRQAFVAMVSHELRTPLSSVSMFLELLEMGVFGGSNEGVAKDLKFASRQTEEVIMLINDLLDLEKLEANKLELVKSECEIEDLIDKAVEAMAPTLDAAEVNLHFEGAEEHVVVDPERITQAVTKMLSSIIRLTPTGEAIVIDVVEAEEGAIQIRLNVAGLRIPEEQVETIFERFQQISLPSIREGSGLGLGLALSRAIIQQHGGTVGLTSSEAGGTTFWINLPDVANSG